MKQASVGGMSNVFKRLLYVLFPYPDVPDPEPLMKRRSKSVVVMLG